MIFKTLQFQSCYLKVDLDLLFDLILFCIQSSNDMGMFGLV